MKSCILTFTLATWVAVPFSACAQPEWQSITPAEAGFDTAKLETLQRDLAARKTDAFLVIRRGKIVCEWYSPGNGPEKRQGTASLAKALVGGLSLLLAMDDGRIAPGDLASQYIPAWKSDPAKARITIRQLATHTSGVEDAEQDDLAHDKLPGWKGAFWRRDPNPFAIAIYQAPIVFQPGTRYAYSNPGMAALSYAVTASLRGTALPDIHSLLEKRIIQPLGIQDSAWSIGYGRAYDTDGLSLYANWGGAAFTPRAAANLASLMLHRGEWNHQQLISRRWVEQALTYVGTPLPQGPLDANAPASGLCWWVNINGGWEGVPTDAFAGAGAGHQIVLVVPSLDLIVVRNGQALALPDRAHGYWSPALQYLLRPVVEAINEKRAYAPSPVIGGIHFADSTGILRKALGSDNWPITWGDDDRQFAAYGDGNGFEPYTDKKLSQGFALIEGSASDLRGVNIRSATGERMGNGAKGLKASGMLMVDGVLYLWVRNAHNAQLAWSADHGKTWEWGFRFPSGFGSPAFLNFGKNYRGARDKYVYTYSQDGASAYESDDSLLLARVAKNRLRDRSSWEFLERLDERGIPIWTADIGRRGEVFRYPRHCRRVDAVYDSALKRYLLAVAYDQENGWGIYDAPEPWGPWTTAFHTGHWDLDHTHGYRLPAKWIEDDGRAMALVFCGLAPYDAFCVRRMILDIR